MEVLLARTRDSKPFSFCSVSLSNSSVFLLSFLRLLSTFDPPRILYHLRSVALLSLCFRVFVHFAPVPS